MSVNSSFDKSTDEQEFQDFFQLFFEQEEEEEHHDDGDEDKEGRTCTMRATNDLKHHPPNQCDYVSGGVSPPARCDYTSTRHRLQPKKNTEDRPQELILDHYQEQRERRIMALSSSAAGSLANSIIDEEISEVRTTAKKQHMTSRITMRSIQNPKNTNTTSAFINRTDSTARRSVDEQGDNSQLQPQEDTAVVRSSGSSGRAIDKNGSNKMISIHRNSPAWGSSSTMETTSWSLSNKDALGSGVGFRKRRDIDINRNSLACQPPFKKRMAPPVIEQNADLIGTNQQQHHQRHSDEEDSSSRPTFSSCNTEGQYRGMNLLSRELSGRDSLSVLFNDAATYNPCVLSATSAEDEEVNKSNKKDLPEQDNKLLVEKGIKGNQNAVNVVSSNDFYLLQQGQMGEHVNHTMMMRYYEQMLLRNSLNSTMALFTPNVAVPYSGYVTTSFLPLQPAKIQQPNSASAIRMQSPQVEPSYDLECKNTTSRENTNNIGQQKKDISIENVSLSTRRRKQTKERERRAELTTKFQVLADLLKDIEAESHDILYPSNFSTDQKDKVDDKLKKNQELAALSQDDHFNLSNRVEIITKTVDILQKLRQTNKSLQQMVTELRDSKRQSE